MGVDSQPVEKLQRRVRRTQSEARKEPLTMVATSVPVTDYKALKDIADLEDKSVSALVRDVIELIPGFVERRQVYRQLEQATDDVVNE